MQAAMLRRCEIDVATAMQQCCNSDSTVNGSVRRCGDGVNAMMSAMLQQRDNVVDGNEQQ